ncbi:MAG TPA: class I SAM-dependent methyltransferase, partial [Flavobacteriaceae bacterium]
ILFDFDKFAKGWYGGLPTLVYRTSSFDLDLRLRYTYFRDIHLYTELLKKGKGICLNFFGSVYRIHQGGIYSSSDQLQRARIGSLGYKELYFKNKDIPALQTKYRYFHKAYLKELLVQDRHFKAFVQTLLYGFYTKDISFIKHEIKRILKHTLLGKLVKRIFYSSKGNTDFPGSKHYWEERYKKNRNSGPGSYGRLAMFKAEILNAFVNNHHIKTIIEYGCGDGNQLSLADYPHYIGFDVSEKALELCKIRFKNDTSKVFYSLEDQTHDHVTAELVLSLDVIYHLIEDAVFEDYMNCLFNSSSRYVIIYSSNYNARLTAHVKCRKFTDWIDTHVSKEWEILDYIKNPYPFDPKDPNNTSMADFYIYKNSC